MKRKLIKILCASLALVMLVPLIGVPAFAADAEVNTIYSNDFEGKTFDTDLDSDGTNDAYLMVNGDDTFRDLNGVISENFHYIMDDPTNEDNDLWRVPMAHSFSDAQNGHRIDGIKPYYTNRENVVIENSIYIPEGTTGWARWRMYGHNDAWETTGSGWRGYKTFYDINLATGDLLLMAEESMKTTLVQGAWYKLSLCINMVSGAVELYVNNELALSGDLGITGVCIEGFWNGMVDVAGTGYYYCDNINVFEGTAPSPDSEANKISITFNGQPYKLNKGTAFSLVEAGKKLLYARIEEAGTVTYTQNATIQPRDGMIIDTCNVEFETLSEAEVRLCSPTGIRYISTIGAEDIDALKQDEHIKELRIGTLIAPSYYYGLMPDAFTKDSISEFKTLDVPATVGEWYPGYTKEGCYTFAGSITNILEENVNLPFSGIGYLEVVLDNDETLAIYGADGWADAPLLTYAEGAFNILEDTDMELSDAEKAYLQAYADKKLDDLTEKFRKELEGLHVLAIGDSTIAGEVPRWEYQWQNWLATDCNWAYTNLAEGGASLSHIEGQYQKSLSHCLQNVAGYQYGVPSDDTNWYYSTESAIGKTNDDVELIIISAGFNDFGGDTIYAKLGEMSMENKDTTTYLGSWNLVLELLQERYKNAKIVIINQWYLPTTWVSDARGDNMTCYEFTNSVATLYEKFYKDNDRIYLIDAGDPGVSGVDMMDYNFRVEHARKPEDCFHLNAKGMAVMKAAMLPYIWSIMTRGLK